MHTLSQLKKQQVGLRLPKYIVDEIDEMSDLFSINRTDIITEAIDSYVREQKALLFYENFDHSVKNARKMMNGELEEQSLGQLINELETDSNA